MLGHAQRREHIVAATTPYAVARIGDRSCMMRPHKAMHTEAPGLAARRIAAEILEGVLRQRRPLDEQLDGEHVHPGLPALEDRDRALVRMLAATVLRRLGTLRHLLGLYLKE